MIIKPFADIGNFTTFPNAVLDYVMPACSGNVWKVVCATIRKTIGWNKSKDKISLSQYADLTGITNRKSLRSAIRDAVEAGYLIRIGGGNNAFVYGLNPEFTVDTEKQVGTEVYPQAGTQLYPPKLQAGTEVYLEGGTEVYPKLGTEVYPTKEINKKKNIYRDFMTSFLDMVGHPLETEEQTSLVLAWVKKYGETRVLDALQYYIGKGFKVDDNLLTRMGRALPTWRDNGQPAARGVYPGRPTDTRPATIIHLSNGEDE